MICYDLQLRHKMNNYVPLMLGRCPIIYVYCVLAIIYHLKNVTNDFWLVYTFFGVWTGPIVGPKINGACKYLQIL